MANALAPEIASALTRGATILTGNQRAARALRQAWDRHMQSQSTLRWTPAKVLAWSTWTAGLYHSMLLEGTAEALLLNRSQEALLWREIIAADESLSTLRTPSTLVSMASQAWTTLARYRGLGRLKNSATNTDTDSFTHWAAVFEERCRLGRFVPEARLEGALRRAVLDRTLQFHGEILLTGFDRILPAQKALLDALADQGVHIESLDLPPFPETRLLATATDEDHELRIAATWIRQYLDRNQGSRIAVIVPNLSTERPRIARVFREILTPEAQSIASTGQTTFEFSASQPFAERPMVAIALDLLNFAHEPLDLDRIGCILLSPYFASSAELSARAEFDAFELRQTTLLRPEFTLRRLVARLESARRRASLTRTLAALKALAATAERRLALNETKPYGEWADIVRELLTAAGWSRRNSTDSIEFQTQERWNALLDELSTLDFEGRRVPYASALEALRSIASASIFAPESHDAPVQILNPEESAGQSFDAVWFLRAGERSWPQPVSGSPLLSWPLRRELGIPGSVISDDTAYAQWVTTRVARCAAETVIFSYAQTLPEESQKPSPTLGELKLAPFQAPPEDAAQPPILLDQIPDNTPIQPLPDRPVSGGARVLQTQAACGFRAFAEHRLHASELDPIELGMDARARGNLVHLVLEAFWGVVRTQSALRGMTTEARRAELSHAVDAALAKTAARPETPWDEAFLEAQRQRLISLALDWLTLEANRATPFTVAERELQLRDVAIGPLRLSLRIDRIDEVPSGAVLIDYKTGAANPSAWLTDRPDEPQLPLYAVLADELSLQAVAFGRVRAGRDMGFTGFEETPGILTSPARNFPGMETQLLSWYETLVALAEDFASGTAHVSPKLYPGTCTYCAHRLLCRLDPATLLSIENEEEELV